MVSSISATFIGPRGGVCGLERDASVVGMEMPLERVDVVQWVWMMLGPSPLLWVSFGGY